LIFSSQVFSKRADFWIAALRLDDLIKQEVSLDELIQS